MAGRVGTFVFGSLLGAGLGAAAGYLFTPGSGDEVRGMIRDRIDSARNAGEEARIAKEREMIDRFRQGVSDPTALATAGEA